MRILFDKIIYLYLATMGFNLHNDTRILYSNTYAKKEAIKYLFQGKETSVDYAQLKNYALRLSQLLKANSVNTVITMLHNCVEWDIIDFACYLSKITHVSLNPLTETELIRNVVTKIKPSIVFASHKFNLHKLEAIFKNSGIEVRLVSLQNESAKENFYSELNQQHPAKPEETKEDFNDTTSFLQTIIYTSGSSGIAKGVMLSNKNLSAAVNMFSKALFFEDCNVALSLLPVSFSGERKLNYTYKARGITICYPSQQQSLEQALLFFKPDIVAVVPYLLDQLKDIFEKAEVNDFGFLKAIVCGGAPIPFQTQVFFEQKNIPLYELYGLTETASVLSFNDKNCHKKGTVGKVPSGMKVKIAGDGEILCKGKNVTLGYWNDESKTQQLFANDGWLATGDIGEFDEDGFLKITGRKKSAFKNSRGLFISPEELEKKIAEHPLIQYAVVSGENANYINVVLLLRRNEKEFDYNTEELLKKWICKCNNSFKEHERIDYLYIIHEVEWRADKIQTLSMKIDRNYISQLIKEKKPIRLYSLSAYD